MRFPVLETGRITGKRPGKDMMKVKSKQESKQQAINHRTTVSLCEAILNSIVDLFLSCNLCIVDFTKTK